MKEEKKHNLRLSMCWRCWPFETEICSCHKTTEIWLCKAPENLGLRSDIGYCRDEACKPKVEKIRLEAKVGCHKCGKPAKAPYSYWASEKLIGGDYCEEHLKEIKNACKNCHEFISKGILVGCKACDNTRLKNLTP